MEVNRAVVADRAELRLIDGLLISTLAAVDASEKCMDAGQQLCLG